MFAQSASDSSGFILEGIVKDDNTQKSIPYARVYNQSNGTGTISNLEGFYRLSAVQISDTIVFSFVGYEKQKLVAADVAKKKAVFLVPKTELLPEVEIFADDPFLFDLVASCRKSGTYKTRTAKTYFELESYIDNKQVELVECYYNGVFAGYDVSDLQLKNGRFALAPFGNRLFISTETSKAIHMHKLLEENSFFPVSPLALNKAKLKKQFALKLLAKYHDGNESTVYVIDYKPRDTLRTGFEGKLWIDSLSGNVLKVIYKLENANIHPFTMIAREESGLLRADLQISKTYQQLDGKMYVNAIDFSYKLRFKYKENDSVQTVSANAILYAYAYDDAFTLPFFEFTEGMYGDYVKILAAPYNEFFWRNMNEFKLNSLKDQNELFFRTNGNSTAQARPGHAVDSSRYWFEKPYMLWSEKRIVFREDLDKKYVPLTAATPVQLYNFKVQLYMDVNTFNDSLQFLTATVFDPFETFFYYPINNLSLAFINIYFDLMEIQRRELEAEILSKAKNLEEIKQLYAAKLKTAALISQTYLREVDRGTNKENLLKWNDYVNEKLRIDNVMIFNPYP